jgi:hypothetical protein
MSIHQEAQTVAAKSDCPIRYVLPHMETGMGSHDKMLCVAVIARILEGRRSTDDRGNAQEHTLPDSCYEKPCRRRSLTS